MFRDYSGKDSGTSIIAASVHWYDLPFILRKYLYIKKLLVCHVCERTLQTIVEL